MNLAGDLTHHPFLWDRGVLTDLGTLGGTNGEAYWINDAAEIVGRADLTATTNHHAVLWKNGKITDLGVAAGWPCSTAIDINARGQVIIDTGICGVGGGPGLLWENGGPSVDLNALVEPGSTITVGDVNYISDSGEIAVTGMLPNGDQHAVLLVPDGDCDDAVEARIAASQNNAAPTQYTGTMKQGSESRVSPANQFRNRFMQRTAPPVRRLHLRTSRRAVRLSEIGMPRRNAAKGRTSGPALRSSYKARCPTHGSLASWDRGLARAITRICVLWARRNITHIIGGPCFCVFAGDTSVRAMRAL